MVMQSLGEVTITPSPSPVAWVSAGPAVGGDFSASNLGQYLRPHEGTTQISPTCIGFARPRFGDETAAARRRRRSTRVRLRSAAKRATRAARFVVVHNKKRNGKTVGSREWRQSHDGRSSKEENFVAGS